MNSQNLEVYMNDAIKNGGLIAYGDIPLACLTDYQGDPILSSGTTLKKASSNFGDVIRWTATADETDDEILFHTLLPRNFREYRSDAWQPYYKWHVKYRKLDTTGGASNNADLAITGTFKFHAPTGTAIVSVAADNVVLAADVADAAEEGAATATFDWIDNMTTAQRQALVAGSSYWIELEPNEAVGTNLAVEIIGISWEMGVHLKA